MCLYAVIVLCTIFFNEPDSIVRGIYINPYQAARRDYLKKIFARADSGLINTIVVDFKSDYGFLSYRSKLEMVRKLDAYKPYIDVEYLVENARVHNLKLVARIVCFRDEYLAYYKDYGITDDSGRVWVDNKGIAWVNPYNKGVQEYLLEVIKEVVGLGIKSIALDYVRFPTDGAVDRIRLTRVCGPRTEPIIEFLKLIKEEVDVELGVCVYGFSVWHKLKTEGQDISMMEPYIDVLYPMLYPSHFGSSFHGGVNEYWRNYWIYFDSVKEVLKKFSPQVRIIPFVQGFDWKAEEFNEGYIIAQINGALSAGADGFIVWHAGGDYTTSWPALFWAHSAVLNRYARMSLSNHRRVPGYRYQERNFVQVLSQRKNRMTVRKGSLHHSLNDIQPSRRSLRPFSDPLIP